MYTSKVVLVIANTITTNTGSPVIAVFQTFLQCAGPRGTKYQKPQPQTINKHGMGSKPLGNKFQIQILMFWVVSEPQKMTTLI